MTAERVDPLNGGARDGQALTDQEIAAVVQRCPGKGTSLHGYGGHYCHCEAEARAVVWRLREAGLVVVRRGE